MKELYRLKFLKVNLRWSEFFTEDAWSGISESENSQALIRYFTSFCDIQPDLPAFQGGKVDLLRGLRKLCEGFGAHS